MPVSSKGKLRTQTLRIGLGSLGGLALVAGAATWRVARASRDLGTRPDPAPDYDAALARFAAFSADEGEDIHAVCHSRLLTHGHRVERAIILIHGITNCPQQFAALGDQLFAAGWNVLIPCLPRHGLCDRMTSALAQLTAAELRDYGDRTVDIAAGLGDQVTIAGLSAGGVVAAWAAQHRRDVHRAVLIAPSLGMGQFRLRMQVLLTALALTFPDIETQHFRPFDDAAPYSYLGFSTRSLAEVTSLGMATVRAALRTPPAARNVLVVTNAADPAVSNTVTRQLVNLWQAHGLEWVESYEFPKALGLLHDMIDPIQAKQRVDVVYPVLLDLLARGEPYGPAARE